MTKIFRRVIQRKISYDLYKDEKGFWEEGNERLYETSVDFLEIKHSYT